MSEEKEQSSPSKGSPRKLLAAAKTLRGTAAFGLTEHQLMLADLFKSSKPKIPEGEPKNIEVLQQLAKPLARHKVRKFTEEEEAAREEAKKQQKPHDLPEPKNLEFLQNLAKPLPRLAVKKFEEEIAAERQKPTGAKELPEPKNIERLQEMAKPLRKTKKFSDVIAEEEAAAAKKGNAKFDPTVKRPPQRKKSPPKPKKKEEKLADQPTPATTAASSSSSSVPSQSSQEETKSVDAPTSADGPSNDEVAPSSTSNGDGTTEAIEPSPTEQEAEEAH